MERDLQIEVIRWGNQFDLSRIVRYLKEREKEQGGFMFAPELYPDIEVTYYALRTLQLLKADIDPRQDGEPLRFCRISILRPCRSSSVGNIFSVAKPIAEGLAGPCQFSIYRKYFPRSGGVAPVRKNGRRLNGWKGRLRMVIS